MPYKTQEKLQEKLDRFYEERSAHYREIEAMHPGKPDVAERSHTSPEGEQDDLEMHWDQVRREWYDPEEEGLLEEIREAGFGARFSSGTGRMEIIPQEQPEGSRDAGRPGCGETDAEEQAFPGGEEEWGCRDGEEWDL